MSAIADYRNWKWEIPLSGGGKDTVDLTLHLRGRETLYLNRTQISSRSVFKLKSDYTFALSDGRTVQLQIRADWSALGMPQCQLTVDGVKVQPTAGANAAVLPTKEPPPYSPKKGMAFICLETYRLFSLCGILGLLFWLGSRMGARSFLPGILLIPIFGIALYQNVKTYLRTFRKCKAIGAPVVETLYREHFISFYRRRVSARLIPPSGAMMVFIAALGAGFLGLGILLVVKRLFHKMGWEQSIFWFMFFCLPALIFGFGIVRLLEAIKQRVSFRQSVEAWYLIAEKKRLALIENPSQRRRKWKIACSVVGFIVGLGILGSGAWKYVPSGAPNTQGVLAFLIGMLMLVAPIFALEAYLYE